MSTEGTVGGHGNLWMEGKGRDNLAPRWRSPKTDMRIEGSCRVFLRWLYAFRPEMKENGVTATHKPGIQKRKARDNGAIATVGHHHQDICTSTLSLE